LLEALVASKCSRLELLVELEAAAAQHMMAAVLVGPVQAAELVEVLRFRLAV
jgi:hypothetical protein